MFVCVCVCFFVCVCVCVCLCSSLFLISTLNENFIDFDRMGNMTSMLKEFKDLPMIYLCNETVCPFCPVLNISISTNIQRLNDKFNNCKKKIEGKNG